MNSVGVNLDKFIYTVIFNLLSHLGHIMRSQISSLLRAVMEQNPVEKRRLGRQKMS